MLAGDERNSLWTQLSFIVDPGMPQAMSKSERIYLHLPYNLNGL